jgi:hypothetical protein
MNSTNKCLVHADYVNLKKNMNTIKPETLLNCSTKVGLKIDAEKT